MKRSFLIFSAIFSVFLLSSCKECKFEEISTKTLPAARIHREYEAKISTQQTCSPFAKYYIIKEGSLPEGLKINDKGEIKGIPQQAGIWQFTILIEICFSAQNGFDSDCHSKTAEFNLEVVPY